MKYADMQAAIAQDRYAKAKGRKAKEDPIVVTTGGREGKPTRSAPTYRPEPERGDVESYPLLAQVDAETWLKDRLLQHHADVYCAGEFANLRERFRHVIVVEKLATAIIGRHNGKAETYAQCFERLYGEPLKAPRGTTDTQHPTSKVTR